MAATVRLAREQDLPLTIRSGGHSLAGHSSLDGAILLDVGDLRGLTIDPVARLAQVGPGLTAGAYAAAAQAYGLATPHGDTGTVGIGGLTLGGGIGWLVRKYGLTIDSLVSVELVTADGRIITVDAEHEPELFWGLRGGGGNLGIATRFTTRLHPVDRFMGGAIVLPPTADVVGRRAGGGGRRAGGPDGHPGRDAPAADALRARRAARHARPGRPGRLDRLPSRPASGRSPRSGPSPRPSATWSRRCPIRPSTA